MMVVLEFSYNFDVAVGGEQASPVLSCVTIFTGSLGPGFCLLKFFSTVYFSQIFRHILNFMDIFEN